MLIIVDENGVASGSFRNTNVPGDYTIHATASGSLGSGAENQLRETSSRFLVFDQNLELDNPVADPTLLGSLASMTGGSLVPPETLPKLLEDLAEKSELLTEKRETKRSLYDTWPMMILFFTVLCGEWFLRKRSGLV